MKGYIAPLSLGLLGATLGVLGDSFLIARRAQDSESAPPSVEPAASAPALSPSEAAARAEADFASDTQAYEARLASEPPDAAWTRQIEERLRDAIERGRMPGSQTAQVECKATICKVTAPHSDEPSAERFAYALPVSLGDGVGVGRIARAATSAGVITTSYFSRRGGELPGTMQPGDPRSARRQ